MFVLNVSLIASPSEERELALAYADTGIEFNSILVKLHSNLISHTCLFTSVPSIFCPSPQAKKHHCPRSSSRPTLSLNISLPTASLVSQRLIIASWVFAGIKASSINSAADAGLEINDNTLQNDEKKKTKTKLYDIALNECV